MGVLKKKGDWWDPIANELCYTTNTQKPWPSNYLHFKFKTSEYQPESFLLNYFIYFRFFSLLLRKFTIEVKKTKKVKLQKKLKSNYYLIY